ncbi:MAG TPA: hypothetical protein VK724_05245 [Bryobacteraceae bacterium]|jgi:hypothetical protein|nr:hypothetical protein [Bryobacteraceae bacterium]
MLPIASIARAAVPTLTPLADPANRITIDTQQLLVALPLTGTELLNADGSTSVTVDFPNGPAVANVTDSPKATSTNLTAIVAVPVAYKYTGVSVLVAVKTKSGTSGSVTYVLETPEQTIKRTVPDRANQTTLLDALHATEKPDDAIARLGNGLDEKDKRFLTDAFQKALKEGFALSTPNVKNNVSVQAVMLPFDVCKAIFGAEIAQRYTAIEVIVSNRTPDAALIVQSIYIDYSEWGLAGGLGAKHYIDNVQNYEAGTEKGHIASVEARLVRGDLLDAAVWSKRNLTIRALQLAGTLAAGYEFSIKERGIIKGIGAFNGQVVPGAETFWPDSSIAQANRISDFGFQVNKVVAKQSAELIVAFYPMSRFLTPGLQEVFRRAPALLFTPTSLAFDKQAFELLKKYAPDVLSDNAPVDQSHDQGTNKDKVECKSDRQCLQEYLKKAGPEAERAVLNAQKAALDPKQAALDADEAQKKCAADRGCMINAFLNTFSLNHVRVVVGGIMTVDIATIPPSIESIVVDGGNTAATWAAAGDKTATITGKYLTGAKVNILDADKYGITNVATVATGSTDTTLKFKFTAKPLPVDTLLTITVTKETKVDGQDKTLTSNPYLLRVAYNPPDPKITPPETIEGSKITIKGTDLYDVNNTLAVSLQPSGPKDSATAAVTIPKEAITLKPTEIDIDLTKVTTLATKGALAPACWTPNVSISGVPVLGATAFPQPAAPSIKTATISKDGKQVDVTGDGFLEACDDKLEFQVQDGAKAPQTIKKPTFTSVTGATLDNSPDMSSGTWKLSVLVGGKEQGSAVTIPKATVAAPKPAANATNPAAPANPPAAAPKKPKN